MASLGVESMGLRFKNKITKSILRLNSSNRRFSQCTFDYLQRLARGGVRKEKASNFVIDTI